MKARQIKKQVALMPDLELLEHLAYCDNKRLKKLVECEFDKRFKVTLQTEEEMAESLAHISYEADELLNNSFCKCTNF